MLFFLIMLGIIFLISLILYIVFLSVLEIEFKDLRFNSNNKKNNKLENYLIYIRVKFIAKITFIKIKMDYKKIEKYKLFNNKIMNKLINIRDLLPLLIEKREENLKKLNIKIKKINLNIKIGALDAMLTALVTAIISTILSIFIANENKNSNSENYKYIITPLYSDKLELFINLNCIINVKIVHIIHIVYMLYKKKRSVENDERTSNRRPYVCSND